MSSKRILAYAPSNIAWVKYMGKLDASVGGRNLPENPSLSMTLDELRTWVEVRDFGENPVWINEMPAQLCATVPQLSEAAQKRILEHATRVASSLPERLPQFRFRPMRGFALRSANTFPIGAGIASSASSFAAVTLAMAAWALEEIEPFQSAYEARDPLLMKALSELAREGSGSACRSIEGPFTFWEGTAAKRVSSDLPRLAHFVIVLSAREKEVSSSEAHRRIKSSPLWQGRAQRATERAQNLQPAIARGDFDTCVRLAWEDCQDMHELFHTSDPPFSYQSGLTREALEFLQQFSSKALITMDAGPNIHLTVPEKESASWSARLEKRFGGAHVLRDRPGPGAQVTAWQ